ncbi:37S ribosomal protein S23, mitochondrial [Purpureocillium lavendulum]|uniref:37S ribosomal protein S23, mitochondrial n=1 Tax=Purpureocillium lavendulum TaxID=1247861 RepID=A0AB34G3Q5_9HYPO|nr:37S ribosomal protein S23, mitochondrial [Purpureocillium lavendulum]
MSPTAEDVENWKDQQGGRPGTFPDPQAYRDLARYSSLFTQARSLRRPPANAVPVAPIHRGEQAAAALEANLTTLESKLDAMLDAFEDRAGASSGSADKKTATTKIGEASSSAKSGNDKEQADDRGKKPQ